MAKLFERGDVVAYKRKADDMRHDGRSAAFYERGTTVPLRPLLWGEHGLRSIPPLRAPLGGFADLVGIQIQKG
jgi:hypothetical protein